MEKYAYAFWIAVILCVAYGRLVVSTPDATTACLAHHSEDTCTQALVR